jgi:hypothetical protein
MAIMSRSVIVVMMAVMMVVAVVSVIIVRPAVSYPDIHNGCNIPATIVERVITPVIGGSEVWIVPSRVV